MIKKKYLGGAFILAVAFLGFYKKDSSVNYVMAPVKPSEPQALASAVAAAPRMIIDQNKKPLARIPASAHYLNTPAIDWEEKLEDKLKEQAGDSLKEIAIVKERSLIWMRDQNPLHVEAVRISMVNQQDVKASFRALVDSQTGKVLESYDQTIFDPADIRAEYRLNLDQRNAN